MEIIVKFYSVAYKNKINKSCKNHDPEIYLKGKKEKKKEHQNQLNSSNILAFHMTGSP